MGLIDIVGKQINKGDSVLFPQGKKLRVGIIKKVNPKTVSISPIDDVKVGWYYPRNIYVIDHPAITLQILEK